MSQQQKKFLQSFYNSPQITLLKNKLIQPTVFYSPVINQGQIDPQKLRKINRSWTDYDYQPKRIVNNTDKKQKREATTSVSPRNIESKDINDKNHLEKQTYILPPVKSIRKLLKNNRSLLQKQQSILSYIKDKKSDKNHSDHSQIAQSPIIDKKKSDKDQLGQFLKNSKSKERKIVYYQPQQIKKYSLGLASMRKKSIKKNQGSIKPKVKLGVSIYLRKQRAKTEIQMRKDIQFINFFELKTQFATTPDFSLEYLLYKDSKRLQQSLLKRGPVIPNKQNIKQLLARYQPSNQQINMKKMMKNNFCTVQFNKNGVYVGEMIGKVKSGMGILFLQSSTYEGFWRNNIIQKGVEITKEGIYKGTFANYLKQGKGQFQWNNGQIYVGDWLKGVQHGHGLWVNPKGESYKGQWRNGKAEGIGFLMIKNTNTQKCGKKYKGGFVANKRHGFGKQAFANGDIYEGFYKDDKPDGKGKYYWSNGSTYEGQFCHGLRQGVGSLKTPNNSSYTGQFQQDKAEGECQVRLPNGDVYYGMIREGKKNGKGTLKLYESKQIFNGYWKDDFFVRHEVSRR